MYQVEWELNLRGIDFLTIGQAIDPPHRLLKGQDPPQLARHPTLQRLGPQAQPVTADQSAAGQQVQAPDFQG